MGEPSSFPGCCTLRKRLVQSTGQPASDERSCVCELKDNNGSEVCGGERGPTNQNGSDRLSDDARNENCPPFESLRCTFEQSKRRSPIALGSKGMNLLTRLLSNTLQEFSESLPEYFRSIMSQFDKASGSSDADNENMPTDLRIFYRVVVETFHEQLVVYRTSIAFVEDNFINNIRQRTGYLWDEVLATPMRKFYAIAHRLFSESG